MAITLRDEHFYVRPLTDSDLAACYKLEVVTFPPAERATLEKEQIKYRLQNFSNISLGLFTEIGDVLIGHICATTTSNTVILDEHLIPTVGEKHARTRSDRTVCLQVLAIDPRYQRTGLGRKLLMEYLDRLEKTSSIFGFERVSLLAHDHLISWYESFGFVNCGASRCSFGDGDWNDLVRKLGQC